MDTFGTERSASIKEPPLNQPEEFKDDFFNKNVTRTKNKTDGLQIGVNFSSANVLSMGTISKY